MRSYIGKSASECGDAKTLTRDEMLSSAIETANRYLDETVALRVKVAALEGERNRLRSDAESARDAELELREKHHRETAERIDELAALRADRDRLAGLLDESAVYLGAFVVTSGGPAALDLFTRVSAALGVDVAPGAKGTT